MNMPRGIYLRGYDSRTMPQGRDVDLKSMLILINIIIIMAIITKIIMLITIIIATI